MRTISLALLGAVACIATSLPARAGDPTGLWLTEDGDAKIRIAPCGGNICGSIVWLKNPNDAGGKPKLDKNNAEDGKTYSGSFALAGANKAELKGCVMIICKTKTWMRTN